MGRKRLACGLGVAWNVLIQQPKKNISTSTIKMISRSEPDFRLTAIMNTQTCAQSRLNGWSLPMIQQNGQLTFHPMKHGIAETSVFDRVTGLVNRVCDTKYHIRSANPSISKKAKNSKIPKMGIFASRI